MKFDTIGSLEAYANKFEFVCAKITNLGLSVDNKIDRFVRGLKLEIHE